MDRQLDQVVHRTVAQDFKIKLDEANLRLADLLGLGIFGRN
jgi:hypothetical protein